MTQEARRWWRNCTEVADEEMRAIDALEDSLSPLDQETIHIRRLIGCFESCHHKAVRHAEIIIEAIGAGRTDKGQGRPDPARLDPREEEYEALIKILSSWRAGAEPPEAMHVGGHSAREWVALLGEPTPLKRWQVETVIEKLRRFLDRKARWSAAQASFVDIPGATDHAEFREQTRQTIMHDTDNGAPASITLAQGIDRLTGCNWNFVENVRIVLAAIGGDLSPRTPLALDARNLALNPACLRLRTIAATLRAFCNGAESAKDVDPGIIAKLGPKTPVKHWLAASLEKTLRLQLGAEA